MKQHSKHTNEKYCPVCNEPWEYCLCDDLYPEPSLIESDDENIVNSIDFGQ